MRNSIKRLSLVSGTGQGSVTSNIDTRNLPYLLRCQTVENAFPVDLIKVRSGRKERADKLERSFQYNFRYTPKLRGSSRNNSMCSKSTLAKTPESGSMCKVRESMMSMVNDSHSSQRGMAQSTNIPSTSQRRENHNHIPYQGSSRDEYEYPPTYSSNRPLGGVSWDDEINPPPIPIKYLVNKYSNPSHQEQFSYNTISQIAQKLKDAQGLITPIKTLIGYNLQTGEKSDNEISINPKVHSYSSKSRASGLDLNLIISKRESHSALRRTIENSQISNSALGHLQGGNTPNTSGDRRENSRNSFYDYTPPKSFYNTRQQESPKLMNHKAYYNQILNPNRITRAYIKWRTNENRRWCKSKGLLKNHELPIDDIEPFLKELFQFWDIDSSGDIDITEITSALLSLGLAPNSRFVTNLIQTTAIPGKELSVNNLELTFDDFKHIILGGRKSKHILDILNSEVVRYKESPLKETMSRNIGNKYKTVVPGTDLNSPTSSSILHRKRHITTHNQSMGENVRWFENKSPLIGNKRKGLFAVQRLDKESRKDQKIMQIPQSKQFFEKEKTLHEMLDKIYAAAYIHQFFYDKIHVKEQILLLSKKYILKGLAEDVWNYHEALKGSVLQDYKEKLQHDTKSLEIITLLEEKYSATGFRYLEKIAGEYKNNISDIHKHPNLNVRKMLYFLLKQRKKERKREFKFPNHKVEDHYKIIQKWWDELLSKAEEGGSVVKKVEFIKFLRSKRIISKMDESDDVLGKVKMAKGDNMINYQQFLSCFASAIVKGAIENIHAYLSGTFYKHIPVPIGLKLLEYQRNLYFDAISTKKKQEIANINQHNFMQILQEYRYPNEDDSSFLELYREMNLDIINRINKREEEQIEKFRTKISLRRTKVSHHLNSSVIGSIISTDIDKESSASDASVSDEELHQKVTPLPRTLGRRKTSILTPRKRISMQFKIKHNVASSDEVGANNDTNKTKNKVKSVLLAQLVTNTRNKKCSEVLTKSKKRTIDRRSTAFDQFIQGFSN